MIIGIGTDLVRFSRIQRTVQRFPQAFSRKILHFDEQQLFEAVSANSQHRFLAKWFASKEALLKALGTGCSQAVSWQDVIVGRQLSGRPWARFEGNALKVLQKSLRPDTVATIHLTLSDEDDFVQAFAVISMEPKQIL